jgi:hypothetical protein
MRLRPTLRRAWPILSAAVATTGLLGSSGTARAQTIAPVSPGVSSPGAPGAPGDDEDPSRWLKELDVEAGTLDADLKLRELELRDGVRVRLSPYYLRSERIHISLTSWGVRVRGHGILTFCPCDDPPIAIGFSGGYAGPPDELIVEDPTLRLFGVPVFWLPYLWLRSPRKIGLTMPQVSFRGGDGLFLGQGVHFPVGQGLELGAGVYTRGGFATTAELATTRTFSLVRFDYRSAPAVGDRDDIPSGVGLAIDAHGDLGALGIEHAANMTWDLDAIRGARGLRTTLDLEPLARPWDRAAAEARLGPMSLGFDLVDRRGEALDHYGFARPYVALAGATSLGTIGGTSLRAVLGPRFVRGRRADGVGDASWGIEMGAPLGIATMSATTQIDSRLAHAGSYSPGELDGALPPSTAPFQGDGRGGAIVGEGKLEFSLPLARRLRLEHAAGGPPVLHVIEPLLRFSGVAARGGGDRGALAGFVAAPIFAATTPSTTTDSYDATSAFAGVASFGARTSIGAMASGIAPGRDPWIGKLIAELTVGTLFAPLRRDAASALTLSYVTRTSSGAGIQLGMQGALARSIREGDDRTLGWVGLGRARFDTSRDGLSIELRSSVRSELPVIGAWALLGSDVAPRLATATGLAAPGATLGLGAGFPIGLGMRLGGDVDAYGEKLASFGRHSDAVASAKLLDVHSTFRYRHPCGCFRFALRGGHVVGREGIDVFASLELARFEANDARDY